MTTRRRDSGQHPPNLTQSREYVRRALEERIALGRELRAFEIESPDELNGPRHEFDRWNNFNRELLIRVFDTPALAEEYGMLGWAPRNSVPRLWRRNVEALKYDYDNRITALESIHERLSLMDEPVGSTHDEVRTTDDRDVRAVFVVHGRDEPLRQAIFEFLRALDLRPLEWDEVIRGTGKGAPYIGEVLDYAFGHAQAVVVLMTPDDEARLRADLQQNGDQGYEKNLTPQARPNVLFEAGMAFARNPDRTVLVEVGELRPFSDIGGRHAVRMNNSAERRKALAIRLQTAGCAANLAGDDWLHAGNFNPPVSMAPDTVSELTRAHVHDVESAQNELLRALVSAQDAVSKRQPFFVATTLSGTSVVHPGLPGGELEAYLGDLDELSRDGYIAPNSSGVDMTSFELTREGFQRGRGTG